MNSDKPSFQKPGQQPSNWQQKPSQQPKPQTAGQNNFGKK
jgi:hypothetical protein